MRAIVLILALGACGPTAAELRGPVSRDIARATKIDAATEAQIDELLGKPIDRDVAVRIAVANSPRLRAAMADLGIAAGELQLATLGGALGATHVDASYRSAGDGAREYELDVVQDVVGLITLPRARAAANATLAATRATAIATAIRLVARTEIAFRDVIAAVQMVELRRTAFEAADAAATLRERMFTSGGTSPLAQARERAAREQARIDLAQAEANVEQRRETLNSLLGLSGSRTKWTATGMLPDAPADAPSLDDIEGAAVAVSLDLVAARARAEGAVNRAGVERVRSVLPDFGVGVALVDDDDGHGNAHTGIGPAVRIGIPLFDPRRGARTQANAQAARAELELTAIAVELRADARAARIAALAAYQQARHIREVVLPLRQQVVDETLKHYNAMDADPFQLVDARRELANAGQAYLDALVRYHAAMSRITALRAGAMLEMVME